MPTVYVRKFSFKDSLSDDEVLEEFDRRQISIGKSNSCICLASYRRYEYLKSVLQLHTRLSPSSASPNVIGTWLDVYYELV